MTHKPAENAGARRAQAEDGAPNASGSQEGAGPRHTTGTPDVSRTPKVPKAPYAWWLTGDVDAFLARTGPFLHADPTFHTTLLTVTHTLRQQGRHAYGDDAPYFGALAEGPAGDVTAAFMCTPPHNLLLTPLPPTTIRAAAALARTLAARDGTGLPGVIADEPTATAFATAWHRHTGAGVAGARHHRLYRLRQLTPPDPAPPGRARTATPADRAVLARWYAAFGEEVEGYSGLAPEVWADSRIAHGGVTLWETPDGTPLALAACSPRIAGQVRITTVYTPPELRGHGYAGAATAALSRAVREAGAARVLLFADRDNPVSNHLYRRVGFRPVADFALLRFTEPETTP